MEDKILIGLYIKMVNGDVIKESCHCMDDLQNMMSRLEDEEWLITEDYYLNKRNIVSIKPIYKQEEA
jgi:hypothetical protein